MIIKLMREKYPIKCDLCKVVEDGKKYVFEAFEGTSTFNSPRTRATKIIDCCHACWMKICGNGYEPKFVEEMKNPNWVSGSKKGSGKEYWIPTNQGRTAPREEPKQEVLVGAV